jgi:Domain of unknown function (DUF4397)
MNVHRLLALSGVAVVAAACGNDDKGSTTPNQSVAYVRYVDAVPDTSALDFRFIDVIDNSPMFPGVTYGQYTPYQATGTGARHIKIFINPAPYRPDSSQIVAKQYLVDTTVTFEANTHYTVLHAGYAKTGATPKQGLYVIKDDLPAQATGKIALRAINGLWGFGNADVFTTTESATDPFASTAMEQNVPVLGPGTAAAAVRAYHVLDARPKTPDANSYKVWVRKAGMATPGATDSTSSTAPARISSDTSFANAVAGTQVDSTAFSALLLPASGTCAKCTKFTKPFTVYMVDQVGRKP